MQTEKKEQVINLQVTEGLEVAVFNNPNHEFLMPIKDVAKGYGVSSGTIRQSLSRHSDELLDNEHYVKGVTICNTYAKVQPHAVFFTKKGIIRLGFFMKSGRAKLFRTWAETLILDIMEQKVKLPEPVKRKHNRLNQSRIVDILADIVKIEDTALRLSLTNKILGGNE